MRSSTASTPRAWCTSVLKGWPLSMAHPTTWCGCEHGCTATSSGRSPSGTLLSSALLKPASTCSSRTRAMSSYGRACKPTLRSTLMWMCSSSAASATRRSTWSVAASCGTSSSSAARRPRNGGHASLAGSRQVSTWGWSTSTSVGGWGTTASSWATTSPFAPRGPRSLEAAHRPMSLRRPPSSPSSPWASRACAGRLHRYA
mmetsp:Transcript_20753/g.44584  ORF Transcript_20753/g.44584 Transcript_20753/m.44584 type:complete len:201 (+) Transcript_20753:479-1081(+)